MSHTVAYRMPDGSRLEFHSTRRGLEMRKQQPMGWAWWFAAEIGLFMVAFLIARAV